MEWRAVRSEEKALNFLWINSCEDKTKHTFIYQR